MEKEKRREENEVFFKNTPGAPTSSPAPAAREPVRPTFLPPREPGNDPANSVPTSRGSWGLRLAPKRRKHQQRGNAQARKPSKAPPLLFALATTIAGNKLASFPVRGQLCWLAKLLLRKRHPGQDPGTSEPACEHDLTSCELPLSSVLFPPNGARD